MSRVLNFVVECLLNPAKYIWLARRLFDYCGVTNFEDFVKRLKKKDQWFTLRADNKEDENFVYLEFSSYKSTS
jgi:hypothetical protein